MTEPLTDEEIERARRILETGDFPYPTGRQQADRHARIWLATVDALRAEVERLTVLAGSYDEMVEQCHAAASERDAATDRATRAEAKLEHIYAGRDAFDAAEGTEWGLMMDAIDKVRDDTPTGGSDGE